MLSFRLSWWILIIQEYGFEIEHYKGTTWIYTLSRNSCDIFYSMPKYESPETHYSCIKENCWPGAYEKIEKYRQMAERVWGD